MGFFKKAQPAKPAYLDQDFSNLRKRYQSLEAALTSEVEEGSLDVKRLIFAGPSATYEIYFHNGLIHNIFRQGDSFFLYNRLPWATEEELSVGDKHTLSSMSTNEDLYNYSNLVAAVPTAEPWLKAVYRGLNLKAAIMLDELLQREEVEVSSDIVYSAALEQALLASDFLKLSPQELSDVMAVEKAKTSTPLQALRLNGLPPESVTLELKREETPKSDVEAFLLQLAVEHASLSRLWAEASVAGFLYSSLCDGIYKLVTAGVLELKGVPEDEEEGLPSMELAEAELPSDAVFELSDDEEAASDDTWSFEEELLDGEEETPHFVPTGYLFDELEADINAILSSHCLEEEELDKVHKYFEQNSRLEAEVKALEEKLEPLTEAYGKGVKSFDELKFETTLENMKNDDSDPAEAEHESLEDLPQVNEQQENANELFFKISELEEQRFKANEQRRKALYGLLGTLPLVEQDEATVAMQDRIEAKIRGIDHVKTVAFHPLKKSKGKAARKVKAMRTLPKRAAEGDTIFSDGCTLAFIYGELVEELGFDPLELYLAHKPEEDPLAHMPQEEAQKLREGYKRLREEQELLQLLQNGDEPSSQEEETTPVVSEETVQEAAEEDSATLLEEAESEVPTSEEVASEEVETREEEKNTDDASTPAEEVDNTHERPEEEAPTTSEE